MAYVEADSFTTQQRVEALVALGVHTSSTKTLQQDVLDRMAQQGGLVQAVLLRHGNTSTVPSGGSPISLTSDLGKMIGKLTDEANAFLAAAYVLLMHVGSKANMDVVRHYLDAADAILGDDGMLADVLNVTSGSLGASHITTGEITPPSRTNRQSEGVRFNSLTEF